MIYFLDEDPRKSAMAHAVEHLNATTEESIRLLSDAAHALLADWRVSSMEKRLLDAHTAVPSDSRFAEIERQIPHPEHDVNHPVVQWVIHDQDAWSWFYDFTRTLLQESSKWTARGPDPVHVSAMAWMNVDAPRPVHVGRIRAVSLKDHPFPLLESIPEEFRYMQPTLRLSPARKDAEPVWTYRLYYWTKYQSHVRYTAARRPWWWTVISDHRLASTRSRG